MAELHVVQLKNFESKLKKSEYYSSKSIDDSKASVYYTPTDGTFSPGALQISPIHINYINENLDAMIGLKPYYNTKLDQHSNRLRLYLDPERLINDGHFDPEAASSVANDKAITSTFMINEIGELEKKRNSNEDNCCARNEDDEGDEDDLEDDYGAEGAAACRRHRQDGDNRKVTKNKIKSSISHENDMLLVNEINVCDMNGGSAINMPYNQISGKGKKRGKIMKKYNEYYYSVENIFDAKALPCNSIHHHLHNHHHPSDHHHCKSSIDKLNIILDETGKTILVNQCDNLLQTSASLPEMKMTTSAEVHGKHVILAVENVPNKSVD